VRLFPQGEAKIVQTLTKDLSAGGLRCLSPVPKAVSTVLTLELDLGQGTEPLNLRANVAWFRQVPESEQFYLGMAFQDLEPRTRERLSRYLAALTPA